MWSVYWSEPAFYICTYLFYIYFDNCFLFGSIFCSFYQMILSFMKCWHWEGLRTLSTADMMLIRSLFPYFALSLPVSLLICSPPAHPLLLSLSLFVFFLCSLHNPNTFQVKRSFSLALVTTKKMRLRNPLGWPICVVHLSSFPTIIKAKESHIVKITAERHSGEKKRPLYMSYLWTFKTILVTTRTELR